MFSTLELPELVPKPHSFLTSGTKSQPSPSTEDLEHSRLRSRLVVYEEDGASKKLGKRSVRPGCGEGAIPWQELPCHEQLGSQDGPERGSYDGESPIQTRHLGWLTQL